jgi:hypothetical protein
MGATVLAKLFIAARGSERHWQRECRGADSLRATACRPRSLAGLRQAGGAGHYVLTEYLEGARAPGATAVGELEGVFEAVGRMHALGILQEDVHLGNFLLGKGKLYVIDGDAIRESASDRGRRLDNLALLFAQLSPAACSGMQAALLAAYRKGNPHLAVDAAQLGRPSPAPARRAWPTTSTSACAIAASSRSAKRVRPFLLLVRTEADFLAPLIARPGCLARAGHLPLKRGRTATLARVEVSGRKLVIKRYNIKGPVHALSRSWRPSRAWHSWLEGASPASSSASPRRVPSR